MISIKKMGKSFKKRNGKGKRLFSGLDLQLLSGRTSVILGESGCGKSTLMRILVGADMCDTGDVLLDGLSPQKCARAGRIGFAEQDPTVLPWKSISSNVELSARLKGKTIKPERLHELLSLVGMNDKESLPASTLSGGERKRIAFIRAFADDPDFVLLDEPFASCDLKTRIAMYDAFVNLHNSAHENSSRTLVLVTHNIEEAALLGMDAIILSGHEPCSVFRQLSLNEKPMPSSAMRPGDILAEQFERNCRLIRETCMAAWADGTQQERQMM